MRKQKRYPRPISRAIWILPKTLEAIATATNVSLGTLQAAMRRDLDPYLTFRIPKRLGGFRQVSQPTPEFARVQKYILSLLHPDYIHAAAFAYAPSKSVADCAKLHEGMVWGVKVDINDFFTSIDEDKVYLSLVRLGLAGKVAKMIARLTTRYPIDSMVQTDDGRFRLVKKSLRQYGKSYKPFRRVGYLPQGSPTSGFLANLAFWDLDCQLADLAEKLHMTYTRYSDDILFSSNNADFTQEKALSLVSVIRRSANTYGFDLNPKKTRILGPGARKQYLGLLLDSPGIRVAVRKKARIEGTVRAIEKFGFVNHACHIGLSSPNSDKLVSDLEIGHKFMNKFWGEIAYLLNVEPVFAKSILEKLVRIAPNDWYLSHPEGGAINIAAALRILSHENRWS